MTTYRVVRRWFTVDEVEANNEDEAYHIVHNARDPQLHQFNYEDDSTEVEVAP